jgi:hypothetical protein
VTCAVVTLYKRRSMMHDCRLNVVLSVSKTQSKRKKVAKPVVECCMTANLKHVVSSRERDQP